MTSHPSTYWVENVLEALDTPGQWYLDRPLGRLYCLPLPGEDLAAAEIIAPHLTQVVRVVGSRDAPVKHLRFEGITFAHTEWQPPADWARIEPGGQSTCRAQCSSTHAKRCASTNA